MHLVLCNKSFTGSHEGRWSLGLMRRGDTVQVGRGETVCVRVAKRSVMIVLGRTGGTVGRTGVRRRTGLLLVLWCAVGLQGRHGRRRVLALGGATFTVELLAFDFPEVVTIVKSEKGG